MAKSIKRNYLYNVLLNISTVLFPLITVPYVSRVLEPDGVGLFNFAITFSGYFSLVALLGIPTYGVRETSKVKDNKIALSRLTSQLMSIAAFTGLVVSVIYLITIAAVGQLSENYIIFLLAGFSIYLAPFKINWFYQGIEEFGFITFRSLVIKILSIICLFVFVHEKNDLILYVILSVLGGVMADVWNFIKMWRSGVKPKIVVTGIKQHINPLLILFTSSIAVSIYTVLDTIMLGFMAGYEEVAYYSNARHVAAVILSVVTSLSIVAVPRVSHYMKNKDYKNINILINKSFSVVSFLAFPVSLGLCCISVTFVPLFFGAKFLGAVLPLMILSLLMIAIGLNNLTGVQILIGMGFDRLFLYSVLVGTISNFVMNLFFIPFWGAIGASLASVVAEFLILIVSATFVYRHTPIRIYSWKDIFKAFAGALSFIPLIWVLRMVFEGWFLIAFFVITGSIMYLLLEYLLRNESIDMFMEVLLKKKNKHEEY